MIKDIIFVLILIIALAVFLCLIIYVSDESKKKGLSFGRQLIELIVSCFYKKACLTNTFDKYSGKLEKEDFEEYIKFIEILGDEYD